MTNRSLKIAAVALVFAVCGCSNNSQPASSNSSGAPTPAPASNAAAPQAQAASSSDSDAIRAAIEDHLHNDRSINMTAMDMSVDSVNVTGDQAEANATFHLKEGGTGMAMTYSLERHAGAWLVTKSQPSDGQFVHPPMDKTHSGSATNPAAPEVPDVTDILKNHSSTKSN